MPAESSAPALDTLTKLLALPPAEAEGLALVLRDPAAYVARFRERLAERSVREPIEGLASVALIDALEAADRAIILDWKFELADATHQIDALLGPDAQRWEGLDADDEEDEPNEVLEQLAEHLAERGQILMCVGLDSDSYECFLVPRADAEQVEELCGALGFDVGRASLA